MRRCAQAFAVCILTLFAQCSRYPAPNYLALFLLGSRGGVSPTVNPIKSVQTFVGNISVNPQTASLTTVDPTKSFVVCTFRMASASYLTNRVPICSLSATQVTVQSGIVDATVFFRGYVAEFSSGVRVQRGSFTLGGAGVLSNTVAISSVDLQKSFVIVQALDEHRTVMGYLQNSTTLYVARNQGTINTDVEWQVVEMQGASVQSGQTTIPNGTLSTTIPISTVSMSQSFVFFSVAGDASSNGNDSEMAVRCDLASGSQLVCQRRDSANTPNVAWYVVSFPDATYVERGVLDTTAATPPANDTDTSLTAAPSTAFDMSRSIAMGSAAIDSGDLDQGLDSASFTVHLVNSNQINTQRGSADDRRAVLGWQLIQFTQN